MLISGSNNKVASHADGLQSPAVTQGTNGRMLRARVSKERRGTADAIITNPTAFDCGFSQLI